MSIADQIIEQGPFPDGETFTVNCTPDEINELRDELIARRGATTYEEWRVTGTWDGADIDHIWTPSEDGDAERGARTMVDFGRARDWTDGPHLHKRTVTVTDWEEAA